MVGCSSSGPSLTRTAAAILVRKAPIAHQGSFPAHCFAFLGADCSEFEVLMASLASSDWAETEDHASGRTYFYNRQSKETRWSEPSSDVAVDGFMRAHGLTEPEAGKPARSMPARPRSSTPPRASPARAARVSMAKREPPSLDAMRGSQSRPKAQRGAAPARPRQKSEAVFLDGVDLSEVSAHASRWPRALQT